MIYEYECIYMKKYMNINYYYYYCYNITIILQYYCYYYFHPTSGLMQILFFDWLRYYRSISNSHRVVKFAGFVNLFILFYSQINTMNLSLLFSVRLVG